MHPVRIGVLFTRELSLQLSIKPSKHFWYDSYGRPPDEEIIKKFGQGNIIASDDQNQNFGTT